MNQYLAEGGSLLITLGEGGERTFNTNINYLTEEYGMVFNSDAVLRTVYHKYFHPKEVQACLPLPSSTPIRPLPSRLLSPLPRAYALPHSSLTAPSPPPLPIPLTRQPTPPTPAHPWRRYSLQPQSLAPPASLPHALILTGAHRKRGAQPRDQ